MINPSATTSRRAAFQGTLRVPGVAVAILVVIWLVAGCGPTAPATLPAPAKPTAADLESVRQKAELGDAASQSLLGEAYLHGSGTARQPELAAQWLSKAAAQGYPPAQCTLGMMYEAGQGVTQDHVQAFEWYRKAAEKDHALAQYSLAALYASGRGVKRNDTEAVRWLTRAAAQGEGLAQFSLGYRLMGGQGTAQDLPEAYKWFALAEAGRIPDAKAAREEAETRMSRSQIAEGRKRVKEFVPVRSATNAAPD